MDYIMDKNDKTKEVVWFKDYVEDYHNEKDPVIKETMKAVLIRKLPYVNSMRKQYNLSVIDQEELLNFNPVKEFKVEAVISVKTRYFSDTIYVNDALIEFIESKGWFFGGTIRPVEDENESR